MVGFISDNVSGIHPQIVQAILEENSGYRMPYGNDVLSKQINNTFSELFETDVTVIPCTSGTAANSLALSLMAGPVNAIAVHQQSHVYVDECNAPEFYSGARLSPLAGANGKIDPHQLDILARTIGEAHSPQPSAISITQTTEIGSVYTLDEIKLISDMAHGYGLKVHMDGARFANAVASLNCSPAELSWRVGVDALSFGGTKNGCMAAEAVVLFDKELIPTAAHRQKRAGQLMSKQRFLAAQLIAYVKHDLWIENAKHGNQQMQKLAKSLSQVDGVKLPDSVESNMIFAQFTAQQNEKLTKKELAGYLFDSGEMRLLCSWATSDQELDAFIECIK